MRGVLCRKISLTITPSSDAKFVDPAIGPTWKQEQLNIVDGGDIESKVLLFNTPLLTLASSKVSYVCPALSILGNLAGLKSVNAVVFNNARGSIYSIYEGDQRDHAPPDITCKNNIAVKSR